MSSNIPKRLWHSTEMFLILLFFVVFCLSSVVVNGKAVKNISSIYEITCDRLQGLPLNETFCVCRMSDTKNLVDLRNLAWSMTDTSRKNPRFVAKDENKGWYVGWSPCSSFSMFTDNVFRPWAACRDAAFGRFENVTNYCETDGYHDRSDFKVTSDDPEAVTRLEIRFRDPRKPGNPVLNIVKLECDKKATTPDFSYSSRTDYGTKVFKFRSSSCCEGDKSIHTPEPPDSMNYEMVIAVSVGSVMFVVVAVPVVIVLYKCRQRLPYDPIEGRRQPAEHEDPVPV